MLKVLFSCLIVQSVVVVGGVQEATHICELVNQKNLFWQNYIKSDNLKQGDCQIKLNVKVTNSSKSPLEKH